MVDHERIRSLYVTARDGALALESGDVEPAFSALGTIRDALYLEAREAGVYLPDEDE